MVNFAVVGESSPTPTPTRQMNAGIENAPINTLAIDQI
jgi:hypothetical protein